MNIAEEPLAADALPRADANARVEPSSAPASPRARRRASSGISWLPRRREVEQSRYDALTMGRKALLCVDGISVSFDGFKALNDLTLVLDEGELRCIIGPNGAGKTTLMDVITGKTKPDAGSVFLVGDTTDLTQLNESEIAQRGVCRKFQRPTVFQGHTVFENLELALPANKSVFHSLFARLTQSDRLTLEKTLETIGLKEQAHTRAGLLSHGQKQWLEIGMLLAQDPRVLLVDEPVAGMTHQETEHTAELLVSLAGERTVVVVEHDMEFVRSIARTVTVLHEGSVLAEGSMDKVQADPRVIEVYLGES
ncbi:MAG TPA: urea ABC transporter ATP-binding protein UrtD [Polyangiaceae bacterium]|nr:urea ABC transporter ATP-binding protein UrtD [Polyangiaceae bacterium]